ncbi:max dimerization protein 3-like isoform X2 [Planococcus citri]|uniref:max dimerization protein 3-like isoform X2 n=1 Tax=Planococcus citri TaxID=170843 RepID=UPI0031F7D5BA
MSIAALLEAAEFLERRDREAEHGYASTRPVLINDLSSRIETKRPKTKKTQGTNRSTHNELEKNRRAHLRGCMDSLKHLVPLGHNSARHTTLGLLIKAKNFIKNLEFQDKRYGIQKETLRREARYLRRKLDQLQVSCNAAAVAAGSAAMKRRSISECSALSSSSSTVSSSSVSASSSSSYLSISSGNNSSLSSNSESDEIDNIGGYFTHSSEDSEDAFSTEGDNSTFDWGDNYILRPRPRVRPNTRVSVSSMQITLSEMDI